MTHEPRHYATMTDALEDALKVFLDDRRGLPCDFWSMSLREIRDVMESIARNAKRRNAERRDEIKSAAVMLQTLSIQTADAVSLMFSRTPRKIRGLDAYYPRLFSPDETEKEAAADRAEKEFFQFCMRWNASRRAERAIAARMQADDSGGDTNAGSR